MNRLFLMGSSLSKSHHHRNYWYEETGQVSRVPLAILVTGILAIVGLGQRRFFGLLFLCALLSVPAFVVAAYVQKQWTQQDNRSVQDRESTLANDMCRAARESRSLLTPAEY